VAAVAPPGMKGTALADRCVVISSGASSSRVAQAHTRVGAVRCRRQALAGFSSHAGSTMPSDDAGRVCAVLEQPQCLVRGVQYAAV